MATLEMEIDRTAFLGTLYKAQGVVDRKSTVNVLSHLLVEPAGDGTVKITGTDYDVVLQADLKAKVLQGGTACINGKSLFDVVKSLDSPSVHLRTLDNHWVEVTAGRSTFKLAGINPDDFPEIAAPTEVQWLGIPRGTLKDLVEKTAFSVSDDETRMNLNGVFFKVGPGEEGRARLTMVSTDGHRLSQVETDVEIEGYEGSQHQAIVHKKGVQEVRRLLEGDDDTVQVGFAEGYILFRAGGTTFTVRQIEDTYPDYERVIPPSSPVKVEVDRKAMIQAVRRIAILTSSKTYIVKMELGPGKMAFTTSNPDYGEGRDEIEVDYDGEGLVVGYNYVYLLEVLNVLKGDKVLLECNDAFSPTVVTAPDEPGALFVVMPMRI
ncbi:MAG: DNA polymerase III subunit beta [Myxococcota bacterium]